MKRTQLTPARKTLARRTRLRRLTALRPISKKRRREARRQATVRDLVFERDGYRCRLAGIPTIPPCFGPLTPHHLAKQSACGEDSIDNEVTLCAGHNAWVEDNPRVARGLGMVHRKPFPQVPSFPRSTP